MADSCPHCGAPLGIVQDAFCSECRASLEEDTSDLAPSTQRSQNYRTLLERFTIPALLVIVLSFITTVCGTAIYTSLILGDLPSGFYPIWFFAAPVAAVTAFLCMAGLALLRACGVQVYRHDDPDPPPEN